MLSNVNLSYYLDEWPSGKTERCEPVSFVGVELNLWPTVYIAIIMLTRKMNQTKSMLCLPSVSITNRFQYYIAYLLLHNLRIQHRLALHAVSTRFLFPTFSAFPFEVEFVSESNRLVNLRFESRIATAFRQFNLTDTLRYQWLIIIIIIIFIIITTLDTF